MRIEPGKALPTPSSSASTSSAPFFRRAPQHPYDDEAINSEDELDNPQYSDLASAAAAEEHFVQQLKQRGLELRPMAQDGNCLFRSVADRVYGDAEMHDVVRRLCLDHMERERDHFSPYVTQDFDDYIRRKRRPMTFGNHLEIQAISEIYNRRVEVFDARGDAQTPINIFQAPEPGDETSSASASASAGSAAAPAPSQPLRLSYHGRSHYNALLDPSMPDAGEGLGLPGLQPGLADRMQLEQARDESEAAALDAQLLNEAQGASEMEATQEALLQAALKASLMEARYPSSHSSNNTAETGVVGHPSSVTSHGDGDSSGGVSGVSGASSKRARTDAPGREEPPTLPESVSTLMAMGFALSRALQAHTLFGDDLDSSLEYLTGD